MYLFPQLRAYQRAEVRCGKQHIFEAVLGNNGCIYWPPLDDYHTLKFDTETQTISRIGDHLGELEH